LSTHKLIPYSDDVKKAHGASTNPSHLTSCYSSKPTNVHNYLSNNREQSS